MAIENVRGAIAASAARGALALPVGLYAAQSDNATTIARVTCAP